MKRIPSLDLARGFTVLIMPSIHVVMLYSQPSVQQSVLGSFLAFIAEGPGAQLFMLIMGMGFTFSKRITSNNVLQRASLLFLAAYGLNFLKFVVPLTFFHLPSNLMEELNLFNTDTAILFFLMMGDILHFAAITYLILYLIYTRKFYHHWAAAIAIAIIFFSPYLWDMKSGIVSMDYVNALLGGHPPEVFFPLLPWLVYPVAGLVVGYFINQYKANLVFRSGAIIGVILMVVSFLVPDKPMAQEWLSFYRTSPIETVFHLGFVFVWLYLFHVLSQKVKYNRVFRLLNFCSKNITVIYLVQWVLICWLLPFAGYMESGFIASCFFMLAVTLFTLMLTYTIQYARKNNL